jgi:hypothetical protein
LKVYGTVNILGKFWPQRSSDISLVEWAADDEGRLLYDADNDHFYYATSTKWQKVSDTDDLFRVNTTLMFASALPTGWNIEENITDKVVILTGSTSLIGQTGGSWVITGISQAGNHNHYTPSNLGLATPQNDVKVTTGDYHTANKNHKHTFNTTGKHSHTFTGSWRPDSVKLAIGVYQG